MAAARQISAIAAVKKVIAVFQRGPCHTSSGPKTNTNGTTKAARQNFTACAAIIIGLASAIDEAA